MSTHDALYDEAVALKEKGDLEGATEKLKAILADDPNHALAHAALSVVYGQLSRFEEAVEHGQKVCELEPDDPFSFVALSLICQKAGLIEEAELASARARHLEYGA
jgi:tetratricopeptide (TPR) repeat protein